ncbi:MULTISPECIES: GFA family protein [Phyllobacteriaceae]|jgi:hypothetical protein|uniref:Aldehyde-activating protein n=1 Tax=Mesorhizobium hungaricum TaxID=1566387 RepID=A0A1C2DC67_9HYPH|nr:MULTISPECIES: GFA family protein [Mesorhizobium]MBN9236736.1 GFA family protein [Mesorhizobium sp.]MDQ0331157.1 hypothetical protein [Mesorhizobium sp. YL-MeA3-2017]OCX12350.1 aldehyde-activating protein [Mesorhizobium hungaricum]
MDSVKPAEQSAKTKTRTAQCGCGGLGITVSGEPRSVYACACLECQRATGTAFSYRAVFVDEAVVQIEGERRSWRRTGGPGRWVEQTFCPTCGALVFMTGEGLPGAVSVSVGCFAEPDFAPPATLFRARRKHHWFEPGPATRISD